jgi:hypothetical protein
MRRLHPRPAPRPHGLPAIGRHAGALVKMTPLRKDASVFGPHLWKSCKAGGCWFPDPFAVFSRLPFASLRVRVFLADGPIKITRAQQRRPVGHPVQHRCNCLEWPDQWLVVASLARPPRTTFDFIAWDFDFGVDSTRLAARHAGLRMSMDPVYSPSSQSAPESGCHLCARPNGTRLRPDMDLDQRLSKTEQC